MSARRKTKPKGRKGRPAAGCSPRDLPAATRNQIKRLVIDGCSSAEIDRRLDLSARGVNVRSLRYEMGRIRKALLLAPAARGRNPARSIDRVLARCLVDFLTTIYSPAFARRVLATAVGFIDAESLATTADKGGDAAAAPEGTR